MSSKKQQMVINYVPGEECRVAIVENGRLEEFHAERMDGPSNHVGNIYVGKVMNVEQSIQAAFIDFGLEQNGFLHTSDVHPQYFPGGENDKTERVGRKTPRRERPPIQDCFRRGDEVAVQVLKEGVGTKGPTVTSYLSIPGRFLVMMPQMDKVGMSRKVEDEETRRKMREILDQLDLPDGFGFILRTAGMERSKAELKRDLAYLMRLWKDMEKRWRSGSKPRLLYSESDLLVRALRDMLTTDIDEVIVDNQAALTRAARFLKIVAPRTSTRLVHYTGKSPVFHVMGIEPQIQMIHAREVPLESGGRLVIDEAEALVAIDVNSGKSREARDSETNAYETNLEAVDEICRQLRLRDLGGVIVNDLIDMRSAKHRHDVEARFADNLKKDRARWTIAPISEFGILEMTRQRMRASHESQHFTDCPTCRGRGLVQKPDSVAADALRELAALLDAQSVQRVELVVHPRIAGELLSTKRRALGRLERSSGKHVDVRVSEAILVDRVTFYAYDERGADLDIPKLGHRRATDSEMVVYDITSDAGEEWAAPMEEQPPEPELYPEDAQAADAEAHPIELEPLSLAEIAAQDRARQQQRQRPSRAGHSENAGQAGHGPQGDEQGGEQGEIGEGGRRRRRRRGRRGRGGANGPQDQPAQFGDANSMQPTDGNYQPDGFGSDGTPPQYSPQGEYAPEGSMDGGAPLQGNGQQPYDASMNGAPMQDGAQGDGPRRRRRRGRRGRGGTGADGFNAGGPQGPAGQPGFAPEFNEQGQPFDGAQPAYGYEGPPATEPYANAPMSEDGAPESGGDDGQQGGQGQGNLGQGNQDQGYGPGDQQQTGPDGGPRPRRRRGRRGGRRDESASGGPPPVGPTGGPNRAQPDQHSLASMFRDTTPMPGNSGNANNAGNAQHYAPAPSESGGAFDGESPTGDPQGDFNGGPQGEPGAPEDGGPRRRRRRGRRGGRGRDAGPDGGSSGGNNDGNNGPHSGGNDFAPPPQAPAPAAPAPRSQPRQAPPPPAAPAPRAQPAPAAPALAGKDKPKVRTLYVSRRRTAPAVVKKAKRQE